MFSKFKQKLHAKEENVIFFYCMYISVTIPVMTLLSSNINIFGHTY